MTSTGRNQAEPPRVTQSSEEEGHSVAVFQHPRAPKMVPNELPAVDQLMQRDPMTINYGIDQWIPPNLLFRNDIRPKIDSRLALSYGARAVAQPIFTCMPTTQWGAVGNPEGGGNGTNGTKGVGFEQVFEPATEPPVVRMIIRTDTGNMIVVDAEQGRPSVMVVDVQRAVIRWMRETRTHSGANNLTRRFSKSARMTDDDGTETELEIWVWKGLRSLSTDMIHWHLHLCEA